ncbi:MAG TPA: YifB family Mg chelatase-like AAA ATPase [Longimicrobiales bacterium]|nr:YifB family Mg chelatase-like AAA ATPase [Longimicrobiales bacterium]
MLAQLLSGAIRGVDAYMVRVEVDLGLGLPCLHVVGLPENAVREGRERVLAALANAGFRIPPRRITVNLAPADIRKEGSAFDLPLALGVLAAAGELPPAGLQRVCCVGELGLDGTVRPVRGVLPIADRCRAEGVHQLMCPPANAAEASVVDGIEVLAVPTLLDAVRHLLGERRLPRARMALRSVPARLAWAGPDFADVQGQELAKRALEIAAAGRHNVLMVGPPGAGKSMLARRLPGILPPLHDQESIQATKVYSVAGRLRAGQALLETRPFRAPHHTISDAGLIGGGNPPRPGEASLAHTGVLFLDELPEFRRHVLETLRQPLEDGTIQLGRAGIMLSYPARFMLVAAMNPCPCGFRGSSRCECTPAQVQRYTGRVSGPLLDRIDLHLEVPPLPSERLSESRRSEPSHDIRARVVQARDRQLQRFRGRSQRYANADMGARELCEHCRLDSAAGHKLRQAAQQLALSARAYHRVLRVARTIADLENSNTVRDVHIAEAVHYRNTTLAQAVGGASV